MNVTKKCNEMGDDNVAEEEEEKTDKSLDETEIKDVIPKNENMYSYKKEDLKKLHDRVFLEDDNILYTLESTSKRHRGLPPIMVAIMGAVHRASRIAEKKGKVFYGLTLFDCQAIFKPCHISNDTIRENIRKLWMNLRLLKRVNVQKTPKTVMQYFTINPEKFPCKDGTFLLGEDEFSPGIDFFGLICRNYPFCSLRPQSCEIVQILTKLHDMLTPEYINRIKNNFKVWIPVEEEITRIEKSLGSELKRIGGVMDEYIAELSDGETRMFGEDLYWAKSEGKYDGELKHARDRIKSKFDAMTKDFIIKTEMERINSLAKDGGLSTAVKQFVESVPSIKWIEYFHAAIDEANATKIPKKQKSRGRESAFDNIP